MAEKAKEKAEITDTPTPVLPKAQPNGELVEVTITLLGDGMVSTGEHVAGEGDIYAARKDKIMVSKAVAVALEARGFAERD